MRRLSGEVASTLVQNYQRSENVDGLHLQVTFFSSL